MSPETFNQSISRDLIERKAAKINAKPLEEKIISLELILANISNPDPKSQDQRDANLDLLRLIDLGSVGQGRLKRTYSQAVFSLKDNLNRDSDPYGEIFMLLEAGKIIAPFVKNVQTITQAWTQIASKFEEKDTQYIMNAVEEIKKLALTQPPKLGPQVEAPLEKPEKIRVRHGGRKQTPEQEELIQAIKRLRSQGRGNLEIASHLSIPYATVANIASHLVKRGEIERLKTGTKKKINNYKEKN